MSRRPERYLALTAKAWNAVRADASALGIHIPLVSRSRIAWSGHWLSLSWRAQRLQHPVHTHATPSLVAGFWRSGTTLLHELLALDPQWASLNTHQCMNPATLLRPPPKSGASSARPMDAMRIDAATPQECEFASLLLGSPSFYRVLLLPESWDRQARFLDPALYTDVEREAWIDDLRAVMTMASVGDSRPLLLKSPTHTFRLDLIRRVFPDAKTVFIHRDPLPVVQSNLRLWRSLFALYALSPSDDKRLLGRVLAVYDLHVRRVIEALPAWSKQNLVAIRYEELVADPARCIEQLYERLGWRFTSTFAIRLREEWGRRRHFVAGQTVADASIDHQIEACTRHPYLGLQAALHAHGVSLDS